MTESLTAETAAEPVAGSAAEDGADGGADSAAQDHEAVQAYLNSFDWQEQLRVARVAREKVLAQRAALEVATADAAARTAELKRPLVAMTRLRSNAAPVPVFFAGRAKPNVMVDSAVAPVAAADAVPATPLVAMPVPAPTPSARQRVLIGLGIGMAVGLAIGLLLPAVTKLVLPALGAPQMTAGQPQLPQVPLAMQLLPQNTSAPPVPAIAQSQAAPFPVAAALTRPDGPDGQAVVGQDLVAVPNVVSSSPDLATVALSGEVTPQPGAALSAATAAAPGLVALPRLAIGTDQGDAPLSPPQLPEPVSILAGAPVPPPPPGTATVAAAISFNAPTQLPTAQITSVSAGLALPENPDMTPAVSESVYIPDAASYRLNLHLARADRGVKLRAQLGDLGLVNASVTASKFSMAETTVAYYQTDDAQVAGMLAALYGGRTMDMTGFTPAPAPRTLDIYLKE